MKTIYSSDNRIFKLLRELTVKKYRDRTGLFIIEGENLIAEAAKSGVKPEYIIIREDCEEKIANCFSGADEKVISDFFSQTKETVLMSRQLLLVA